MGELLGENTNVNLSMKLVLISNIFKPHVRGGYELGCEKIAVDLQNRGHEVIILTSQTIGKLSRMGKNNDLKVLEIFEPIFEYEDLPFFQKSQTWRVRMESAFGGYIPSNMVSLKNTIDFLKPDVIWAFNILGLGPLGIIETVLSFKSKLIIHLMDNIDGVINDYQFQISLTPSWRRMKSNITAISCSKKINISNNALGFYKNNYIVYNGVKNKVGVFHKKKNNEKVIKFIYFGQVEKAKGLSCCAHAFGALKLKNPEYLFEWHIVGTGGQQYHEELKNILNQLKLEKDVIFHGYKDFHELQDIAFQMDYAIMLLSDQEPFGYAPVEAASFGLPVILTKRAGNAECISEKYPLLVENRDDTNEVVSKIIYSIKNREGSEILAEELHESFMKHCDFDKVTMPAYLSIIDSLPVNAGNFKFDDAYTKANYISLYKAMMEAL
jgi:glycosyltransferase involved in cell wall biosynthesis